MNFDTARTMKPAEVADNEEAKKVLADNKDKLTAAELIAFGLEEKPAGTENQPIDASTTGTVTEDDQKVLASLKDGSMVLVKASEHNDLKTRVDAMSEQLETSRQEKVEASVDEQIARGAIVAEAKDKWVKRIMADATVLDDLKEMPTNTLLADQNGKEGGDAKTALQQVNELATKKVEASAKDANGNPSLDHNTAVSQVMNEDKALQAAYYAEQSLATK